MNTRLRNRRSKRRDTVRRAPLNNLFGTNTSSRFEIEDAMAERNDGQRQNTVANPHDEFSMPEPRPEAFAPVAPGSQSANTVVTARDYISEAVPNGGTFDMTQRLKQKRESRIPSLNDCDHNAETCIGWDFEQKALRKAGDYFEELIHEEIDDINDQYYEDMYVEGIVTGIVAAAAAAVNPAVTTAIIVKYAVDAGLSFAMNQLAAMDENASEIEDIAKRGIERLQQVDDLRDEKRSLWDQFYNVAKENDCDPSAATHKYLYDVTRDEMLEVLRTNDIPRSL